MSGKVLVLNGGSSSGKSGLARSLQHLLPEAWLTFGVDTLVDALPARLSTGEGVNIGADGSVSLGDDFRILESAWNAGIAAMVRSGANVVIDEVFLSGAESQARLAAALADLDVTWVGVRCEPEVAVGREIARGDRVLGMAEKQALSVHDGVRYDVEVDTGRSESIECAAQIVDFLHRAEAS
ncbi:chloramphenicol phosphotransferase CPT [Curtobacterium poinsettiae]|uniref:Chloramphenicol phosphotransferase CPT n=1 Tax=Curtobacterium poinsettiae TaxID=159612 RepID=A0ABT3S187_9MICO|nr:chloramphenicol phosphotransferase CPT [Curtobacterium flaccumfaciens]MBT1609714.1 chloramphenicol phosphotransferase CPT [Curtobacterium flaccumfaciens pv. poinsettiae]MCS6574308.1 chloramphenicol phosphotransferase CPT [Curtobacterium flaccumfaciens pv. flaccumfaciens]MCS6577408.1 chloramphenicol phosphotransferase CPT [Curtobacterium flaccumfaciens]MCX2848576.1 chloramphenicol phosphotransferase CPT [Curtobacterium flaccumfaciens pv. poinsettiae]MDD1386560.1 chloramphenicol phosphotransf